MSLYLAVYDISSHRSRRRVARELSRFGHRVQESAFEVMLEGHMPDRLCADLQRQLAVGDCFDLYPIDAAAGRKRYRWARPITAVWGLAEL